MLLKIALTAAVIGLVWLFFIRQSGTRRVGERKPVRLPRIESLARCPECGVYRIYGSSCNCGGGDTPGRG